MKFRPGQRVVCVDDTPALGRVFTLSRGALKRGATYTIRDYVDQSDWVPPLLTDERCVRVHEIVRRYDKIGFRESRFRPFVERKTAKAVKRRLKESA